MNLRRARSSFVPSPVRRWTSSVGPRDGRRAATTAVSVRGRGETCSARSAGLEAARRPKSPETRRKMSEAAKSQGRRPQLPQATRIRLFFVAHPGATDEEVGARLGISRQAVARYRDPASRRPRLDTKLWEVFKAYGWQDRMRGLAPPSP